MAGETELAVCCSFYCALPLCRPAFHSFLLPCPAWEQPATQEIPEMLTLMCGPELAFIINEGAP